VVAHGVMKLMVASGDGEGFAIGTVSQVLQLLATSF
jgi:hypothetical protein